MDGSRAFIGAGGQIGKRVQAPASVLALREAHARFLAACHPPGRDPGATGIDVLGIDFTSAPRPAKPILVARGSLHQRQDRGGRSPQLSVTRLERYERFEAFEALLSTPGPWAAGFDLPFGLPREFVLSQDWPTDWFDCMAVYAGQSRPTLRERFRQFCAARAAGHKFAHRATDGPAGSSPSMKWVNPPVAWMMHAGVPRLVAAGLSLPGMHAGDPARVALEAYPGLLARSVTRASYKSDDRARQTDARRRERARIVAAVQGAGTCPGLSTRFAPGLGEAMVADAAGDALDAVLCLVQAAWAIAHQDACFGLRPGFDPLEGWIVGAR